MSIKVNKVPQPALEPTFEPKSLVISKMANGNIYLVIGPGIDEGHFAGVRLAGAGTFRYQDDLIKDLVVPFNGEVVIKND